MLRLFKYLKSSFASVLLIVVLLILQAQCDLLLPDYTSKIVNVGIQQNGIENAAPEALTKDIMQNLLLFTKEDETILNSYTLISKENSDPKEYEKYAKKYPELENQDLYIIHKLKTKEQEELNTIMAKPIMELSVMQSEEMAKQVKDMLTQQMPEGQKEQMQQMDLLSFVQAMPEEALDKMLAEFDERLKELPDSMIEQAAIGIIKQEYSKIGVDTEKLQNNYILLSGAKMLGIAFASMSAAICVMFLSTRVAAKLGRILREKVFKKVMNFSNKEFSEYSTASLITRSTNDVQQVQMLINMLFRVIVYAPIIGVGGLIRVLTRSNNSMAWIIGVAVFAILCVVGVLFIVAMPKFKKVQELIDKLNLVAREILMGIPVIRAFHKEKDEEKRFDVANKDLTKANLFVNRAMTIMMPTLMLIMNLVTLLIVWVGGHKVDAGIMQVGDMMAFIQYTMQIVMAFLMISMVSVMLPRATVSAKRINEILDSKETIKDPKEPKTFEPSKKGWVEFKKVSFHYPDADEDILTDISFTAKPGETTALIGSTGSGKSTIVNLIPRFFDVTGGELFINGVNVKEVKQADLRRIIGFVPQKGVLFSGTIRSNIKYGKSDATDEEMIEAARIAQATEFIEEKEEKYDSPIAQGGGNVSGGQKQRLSIARAIAKDPDIYVFDDSFSALDYKTDIKLRTELAKNTTNKTVIIVAQRISTILHADKIMVLEDGKIVGMGNHKELMKNNETYRQIALSQLSKEELDNGKE